MRKLLGPPPGPLGRVPHHRRRLIVAAVVLMLGVVAPAAVGHAAGPLVLTPAPADFGTVMVGATGRVTITAKNAGATAVIVERVRLSSPPFLIDQDLCVDRSLSANASCTMAIRFAPVTTGTFSAKLEVETNVGTSSVDLTGNGTPSGGLTTTGVVTTGSVPPPPVTTTQRRPGSPPVTTTVPGATTITTPSTPTTTRTSIRPPVADDQRLRDCERQAHEAKVSYEPTRKMSIGETQQVQVTASVGGEPAPTSVAGRAGASTTLVPVTLRCEVQAQLRGEDFKVTPDGFQQASFLDRPAVTWSWDVVPLKSGPRILTLEIRSVAEIEGRRIEGAGGELFTTAIDVGVNPQNLGEKLTRWSGDVVDHPLIRGFGSLAVVAGALLGAWRWILGRRWPWTKEAG